MHNAEQHIRAFNTRPDTDTDTDTDTVDIAMAGDARDEAPEDRAEVHQAQGMVMVQLNGNLADALVRMRTHAYAHDRRLREVAADVIARRLQFDPDRP